MRLAAWAAFFLLLVTTGLLGCKDATLGPDVTGRIEGTVSDFDTNEAISGASVTTSPPTGALVTDGNGQFVLEDVETGNYTITAARPSYESNTVTISVRENQTTQASIFLQEEDSTDTNAPSLSAEVTSFSNQTAENDTVTVRVEYRVRNTGSATIPAYEVYFRIDTEGEAFFQERDGTDLQAGQLDIRSFRKTLFTRPASDVVVDGTAIGDDDESAS